MQPELGPKYQTLLILWFAMVMSVGLYFLVTIFAAPQAAIDSAHAPDARLVWGLAALGLVFVVASFAVKHKLLDRSVANQNLGLVQQAMIVALAMCEVSALLGLVAFFVIGSREYYLLFLLAAAGMILHAPRRSQLEAAGWNRLPGSMPGP